MSAASGVEVSQSLRSSFQSARSGKNVRFLKVQIKDEQWISTNTGNRKGTWTSDFDLVASTLDKEPCFVIYFKDQANQLLLLCYMPENSSVKDKMVYSSSKSSLKKLIGDDVEEYFSVSKEEFTYSKYSAKQSIAAPLSYVEQELKNSVPTLDRHEMKKSQGYSLIARVKDPDKPAVLDTYVNNGGGSGGMAGIGGGGGVQKGVSTYGRGISSSPPKKFATLGSGGDGSGTKKKKKKSPTHSPNDIGNAINAGRVSKGGRSAASSTSSNSSDVDVSSANVGNLTSAWEQKTGPVVETRPASKSISPPKAAHKEDKKPDAKQAPKAESPKTEAPKTDASKTEAKEAVKVEAPKTEAKEAAKTDAPKAEAAAAATAPAAAAVAADAKDAKQT